MPRLAAITSFGDFGTEVHADHVSSLGDFLPKVKMTQTLKTLSAGLRFHSASEYASFFPCDRSRGLNGLSRHVTGFTEATENPTEKILQMNSKVVNITGRLGEKQLKDGGAWTFGPVPAIPPVPNVIRRRCAPKQHHGRSEDRMQADNSQIIGL